LRLSHSDLTNKNAIFHHKQLVGILLPAWATILGRPSSSGLQLGDL